MLQYVSKKITAQLLHNDIITSSMSEVYQYGLELTLSTLLTSSAIMTLACLMDSFSFGLLYFQCTEEKPADNNSIFLCSLLPDGVFISHITAIGQTELHCSYGIVRCCINITNKKKGVK